MQIVIDIPEQLKKKIDNDFISSENFGNLIWYYALLIESIKDCVVLPEGHGDLIDRKELMDSPYRKGGFVEWYDEIKYANAVIPADKEEGE